MKLGLEIHHVTDVRFGGKTALSGGVLSIDRGELQGIVEFVIVVQRRGRRRVVDLVQIEPVIGERFDEARGEWHSSVAGIAERASSSSLMELLTEKIDALAPSTQDVLRSVALIAKPVPLNMPWPVKAGCSLVACQVQCSMSALVTWTNEKDRLPFQGCCRM